MTTANTMYFGIQWANGHRDVDAASVPDVHAYVMQRWGLDSHEELQDVHGHRVYVLTPAQYKSFNVALAKQQKERNYKHNTIMALKKERAAARRTA